MDQLTDNNPVDYLHLLDQLELPGFVKNASADVSNLPDSAFALESTRELPIDTPANTYQSKVYFELNRSLMKRASEVLANVRLNKAARYHGITEDFKTIESTANSAIEKQASSKVKQARFALSFENEGQHYNAYPITDEEDVRQSAGFLASDRQKTTNAWFKEAARNIIKAANEFNISHTELPPIIVEKGLEREIDTKYASVALRQRERVLSKRAGVSEETTKQDIETYRELFKAATSQSSIPEMEKYASLIEDFDDLNGITFRDVVDTDKAFFSGPESSEIEKAASEYIFIGDAMLPVKAFMDVKFEKIAQHFSKETATKITELQKMAGQIDSIEKSVQVDNELKDLDPLVSAELINLVVNET
jgi:hypothetical protein